MGTPTSERSGDTIEEVARRQMARWTIPGMAIGVLRDGRREIYGYGVASLETVQPVRPDTLFQIGSISKVYTATLVMRLVERGALSLDTPVSAYLPDLRLADEQAQRTITLRHLLSHTSGLFGDYFDDSGMGDDALTKAIAQYHTLRQQFSPGAHWSYCNTGFALAGAVVERVLGMPFEQAMRENLFAPLNLEHTFYFAHEAITYPVAIGHTQTHPGADEHTVAHNYPLPRWVGAAGGIIANVDDLLTFAAFHLGDGSWNGSSILSEASLRAMRQRQTVAANFADAYGLGWALRTVGDEQIVEHGGSTNGFQAKLSLVPARGFAIATLTNSSRGSAANEAVIDWALERYCGATPEKPAPIAAPADQLARFAGVYRRPEGEITLTAVDGGLRREMTLKDMLDGKEETYPPHLLRPIGDLEFVVVADDENDGSRVDFILSDDGAPRFFRMGGRLADHVGKANSPTQASSSRKDETI